MINKEIKNKSTLHNRIDSILSKAITTVMLVLSIGVPIYLLNKRGIPILGILKSIAYAGIGAVLGILISYIILMFRSDTEVSKST